MLIHIKKKKKVEWPAQSRLHRFISGRGHKAINYQRHLPIGMVPFCFSDEGKVRRLQRRATFDQIPPGGCSGGQMEVAAGWPTSKGPESTGMWQYCQPYTLCWRPGACWAQAWLAPAVIESHVSPEPGWGSVWFPNLSWGRQDFFSFLCWVYAYIANGSRSEQCRVWTIWGSLETEPSRKVGENVR